MTSWLKWTMAVSGGILVLMVVYGIGYYRGEMTEFRQAERVIQNLRAMRDARDPGPDVWHQPKFLMNTRDSGTEVWQHTNPDGTDVPHTDGPWGRDCQRMMTHGGVVTNDAMVSGLYQVIRMPDGTAVVRPISSRATITAAGASSSAEIPDGLVSDDGVMVRGLRNPDATYLLVHDEVVQEPYWQDTINPGMISLPIRTQKVVTIFDSLEQAMTFLNGRKIRSIDGLWKVDDRVPVEMRIIERIEPETVQEKRWTEPQWQVKETP